MRIRIKIMFTRYAIALLAILNLFSGLAFAADPYWVDDNGTETTWASCQSASPISGTSACTPATATSNASAGDLVYFRGGTYTVSDSADWRTPSLNPTNSGSIGSPITFQAYTGETPILAHSSGCSDCQGIIGANSRDYITWDGFTIDQTVGGSPGPKGAMINSAESVIIQNCTFIGPTGHSSTDNVEGIRVENSDDVIIQNNVLYDYKQASDYHNTSAIKSYGDDDLIIQNNTIYDSSYGIYLKGGEPANTAINAIVRYNLMYNIDGAGVLVSYHDTGDIYQNIVYNSERGVEFTDDYATNYNVYNNVFYNTDERFVHYWDDSATHSGNKFWNNIGVGPTARAVSVNGVSDSGDVDFEYNLYYTWTDFYYNETQTTWAAWNSTYSYDDVGGISGSDPKFVSPTSDFTLQGDSPAKSAGYVNFDGTGGSVDMGAYITGSEYIGYCADGMGECETTPTSSQSGITLN